jgi:Serine/threonine protein kinase
MQKQISHYQILSKIASGGMANVFLAMDTSTSAKVAIKILKEEVSDKEKILERFAQEGLLNLDHPNIVKILDAGVNKNTPYIVMEYIDGEDLEDLIKGKGKLPVNEALAIFGQLLSALAYVHNRGIIHRDIKPKNILIDKSEKVKLTDFGIAKSISSHVKTATGGYLGAPAYSSPEQMDGLSVDSRADIYSLGITLYEMLSGVTPFSSTSIPTLIKEKFSGKYRHISSYREDVPPHVIFVISKCIAVSPKDRFGSVAAITDALNTTENTDTVILVPKQKPAIADKKILEEEVKLNLEPPKANYDYEAKNKATSGNKATIILSYLSSWVGGLIVFLLEKQNRFIKWNALQGLILGVFETACIILFSYILRHIPYVGWYFFLRLGYVLAGVGWVFGVIAIIMGCNGKTFRIPGISLLADKWFKM